MYLKQLMSSFRLCVPMELTVDSSALQALSTSIKEPEERLNKIDLAVIREAFDEGHIQAVNWCPGPKLVADSLTKNNPLTAAILLETLRTDYRRRPVENKTNLGLPTTERYPMRAKGGV